jgi:hypothetical protein
MSAELLTHLSPWSSVLLRSAIFHYIFPTGPNPALLLLGHMITSNESAYLNRFLNLHTSTLKADEAFPYEMSVSPDYTTPRYKPEDHNIYSLTLLSVAPWSRMHGLWYAITCSWGQEFSLLHDVQTGSGVHPTSYRMGTGGKAAGAWGWPLTSS